MGKTKLDLGKTEAQGARHGSSDGVQQVEDKAVIFQQEAHHEDDHINLSWRSWVG
jgi:hypothetical protein